MENEFENIDFLNGEVELNALNSILAGNENLAIKGTKVDLLKVVYDEYLLIVHGYFVESAFRSFEIAIIKDAADQELIKKTEVTALKHLKNEVQSYIYQLIKMLIWCPQAFCFNWLEAGDSYAPGFYSSTEEGMRHMKVVKKSRCGCSFGDCCRDIEFKDNPTGLKDFHEPCEPRLRKRGLPDEYFIIP